MGKGAKGKAKGERCHSSEVSLVLGAEETGGLIEGTRGNKNYAPSPVPESRMRAFRSGSLMPGAIRPPMHSLMASCWAVFHWSSLSSSSRLLSIILSDFRLSVQVKQ